MVNSHRPEMSSAADGTTRVVECSAVVAAAERNSTRQIANPVRRVIVCTLDVEVREVTTTTITIGPPSQLVEFAALCRDSREDGIFPLSTNDRKLSATEVLRAYKRTPAAFGKALFAVQVGLRGGSGLPEER
jgi:hypothetical protein